MCLTGRWAKESAWAAFAATKLPNYILPLLAKQITAFDDAIPAIFDNLRQQALESGSALIRQSGFRTLMQLENAWNNLRNNPNFDPNQAFSVVNSLFAAGLTVV